MCKNETEEEEWKKNNVCAQFEKVQTQWSADAQSCTVPLLCLYIDNDRFQHK